MQKEVIKHRNEFRKWLYKNHDKEKECWLNLKRGKPTDTGHFWYIDAVEEALCFGWIDSTYKIINGVRLQRFSPRQKRSNWTELNKERVRRLEKLGLMTEFGKAVVGEIEKRRFVADASIVQEIKHLGLWDKFSQTPMLYQRIRLSNLAFYKNKLPKQYKKAFEHFVKKTKAGKMYGQWNDYGRLIDY